MKKALLFPFITIPVLILLYFSFTLAWSSIITERVKKSVALWETQPEKFDGVLADEYISRINIAIELNSSNSDLFVLQARLLTTIYSSSSAQVELSHIYDAYYKAVKLTLTSDKVWARFAKFSSDQGDIKTTLTCIDKTIELGKFELESISIILPLIFKHWNEIEENKRLRDSANKLLKWTLASGNQNTFLSIEEAAKHRRINLIATNTDQQWMVNRSKQKLLELSRGNKNE